MRKGITAATAGEYPRRVAQRESVPAIRERSSLTQHQSPFRPTRRVVALPSSFGARSARSNTGVFSILSGAAPEGVSSAARRNDLVVASSPSTVSLAALPELCGRTGTCWVPPVPGLGRRDLSVPSFVSLHEKETARRSGPSLLVTYRCRSFGRAALWDFYHPCREPGSAGPVSSRRLVVDRASDPALDFAGRVGFGSSCCFLSWEHHNNGSESAPFR